MTYNIWRTDVEGVYHTIPVDRRVMVEAGHETRRQALARVRVLIGPTHWEPCIYEVRDADGRPVSKPYSNRPELIAALAEQGRARRK